MFALPSTALVTGVVGQAPIQAFSGQFVELAVLFFVLALVAAVFGARGVAGVSMTIAKWFVIAFLVLAVVSMVL